MPKNPKRRTATGKRKPAEAVLIGIRDFVHLAAPEPHVLRVVGEVSQRKGTDKLTSRQIDRLVKAARARKPKTGLIPLRSGRNRQHRSFGSLKPAGCT
jgi:hypothetical protein